MTFVKIDQLVEEIVDQCSNEVYEKFPDLVGERIDLEGAFEYEIRNQSDVNAAVKGTPFATPWEKIPRSAKMRCIGFFNICKFLRKSSNNTIARALRDVFSEHVGTDLGDRAMNNLTRLFDESDESDESDGQKSNSPMVEKFLNLFMSQDDPVWKFRDETIKISSESPIKPDAAFVSASNDDYIVITQGTFVDVYDRKNLNAGRIETRRIDFGVVNTTGNSIYDPCVAISDNGQYIVAGSPRAYYGDRDGDIHPSGVLYVFKKSDDSKSSWKLSYTRSLWMGTSWPGFACRGSVDINDHGLLAFTHEDGSSGESFVSIYDTKEGGGGYIMRSDDAILSKSAGNSVIPERSAFRDKDADKNATIQEKTVLKHRFGRTVAFVDKSALDWKIRVGSSAQIISSPVVRLKNDNGIVIEKDSSMTITFEGTFEYWNSEGHGEGLYVKHDDDESANIWLNETKTEEVLFTTEEIPLGDYNTIFETKVHKGRIRDTQIYYSVIPVPMYYEFQGDTVNHTTAYNISEDVETKIYTNPYRTGSAPPESMTHTRIRVPSGSRVGYDTQSIFGLEDLTIREGSGWSEIEPENESTPQYEDSIVCRDGQVVRWYKTESDDVGRLVSYTDIENDSLNFGYRVRDSVINSQPISVDVVGGSIKFFTNDSYDGIQFSPYEKESGARNCIPVDSEYLIGRQFLYKYEFRKKLRIWTLVALVMGYSISSGVGFALLTWYLSNLIMADKAAVVHALLSLMIFILSSGIFATIATVTGMVIRDVDFTDETFFLGKPSLLSLDRDRATTREFDRVVKKSLGKLFVQNFKDFGDGIDQFFENTGEKITDGVTDFKDKIDDGAADLKDKFDDKLDDVKDKIDDGAADLKDKFDDGATDLKDKFDDGVADLKDKFDNGVADLKDKLKDKLSNGDKISDLKEKIEEMSKPKKKPDAQKLKKFFKRDLRPRR
jgi:hypothetical protein